MIGMIQDISTMHDVLHESKTGLWIIEIEDGRQPRMFADQTMMELLGLKTVVTPEKCYEHTNVHNIGMRELPGNIIRWSMPVWKRW